MPGVYIPRPCGPPPSEGGIAPHLGGNNGLLDVATAQHKIPPWKGDQGGCCFMEQRAYPVIGVILTAAAGQGIMRSFGTYVC